jgi:myo-inositol-1(or 4)-monophosphatase
LTTLELRAPRAVASAIAREAGVLLRGYFEGENRQSTKSTAFDIVTEGDEAAEALIVDALQRIYPDHHIVGEEGGGCGAPIEEAAYRWYIDPVDGTTNFANRIPFYSISIALTDHEDNPLVGVVYDPSADELFAAAEGMGAECNHRRIEVSAARTLGEAVLCTGFPYDKGTNPENNLRHWNAFVPQVRGIRRFGSAALDLCWVGCGRLDGFWELKLNPWDCLAGMLIVREAGGQVTAFDNGPVDLTTGRIVASNGPLHPQMLAVLNG